MRTIEDQQMALECLKLAQATDRSLSVDATGVVERAKKYYAFVTGEEK